MTRSLRAGVIAMAAIAIGIGLSGCGSESKAEPSPSQQTSTESSATSSKAAPGRVRTKLMAPPYWTEPLPLHSPIFPHPHTGCD